MSVLIKETTTVNYINLNTLANEKYKLVDIKQATDFKTKSFADFNIEELETMYPQLKFEVVETNKTQTDTSIKEDTILIKRSVNSFGSITVKIETKLSSMEVVATLATVQQVLVSNLIKP